MSPHAPGSLTKRHGAALLQLGVLAAALQLAGPASGQAATQAPSTLDPATAAAMPRYSLRQDMAPVGSNIPRTVMRDSLLPFDRTWQELTPEQRLVMKSHYEAMAESDEPPFPLRGLRVIYTLIETVARHTGDRGPVVMNLSVDSQGQVASVAVIQSPSKEYTQGLARALLQVNFKPALCDGQACRMDFPVRADLHRKLL